MPTHRVNISFLGHVILVKPGSSRCNDDYNHHMFSLAINGLGQPEPAYVSDDYDPHCKRVKIRLHFLVMSFL